MSRRNVIGGIGLVVVMGGMFFMYVPGLIDDYYAKFPIRLALNYRITEAKCRNYLFIAATCSVNYKHIGATEEAVSSIDTLHLGPVGKHPVALVRSADGVLSTTDAMAHIWNRILALGLFAFVGLLMVVGVVRMLLIGRTPASVTPPSA